MSFVSHALGGSRLFDCIYDSNFILGDENEKDQDQYNALNLSTPDRMLCEFDAMFSNLPKEFRGIYHKINITLPKENRFRAGGDKKLDRERKYFFQDINGKYRTSFYQNSESNEFEALHDVRSCQLKGIQKIIVDPCRTKISKSIQTVFRESSAQTYPYQPDAIIDNLDIHESNILLAASVISGYCDPGVVETEILERAIKRRLWEKTMIYLKSKNYIEQYTAVLEAFEWEEWLAREELIEKYQNLRLKIVEKLIRSRSNYYQNSSDNRFDVYIKRTTEYREYKSNQLQSNFNRKLRKLEYKRKNVIRRYHYESPSEEYTNLASELYAPQMRYGVHPKRRHYVGYKDKFKNNSYDLSKKIQGPLQLTCPFTAASILAKPKSLPKEFAIGFCSDKNLKKLYESLKQLRFETSGVRGPPKCMTPKVIESRKIITAIEEKPQPEKSESIVFLPPKESTKIADETTNYQEEEELTYQQNNERTANNKVELNRVLEDFEGSAIGWLLEFFQKEIERLQEQKKIQAMCMLAEEERYKREAIEAGNRQRENRRRAEHQFIYNDATKATRNIVTLFLEDVLVEEIDYKSTKNALSEVRKMAKYIDQTAAKSVSKFGSPGPVKKVSETDQHDIADIVNDFIFPEIHKLFAKRKSDARENRHLIAAQKIFDSTIPKPKPRPPPQSHSKTLLTDCVFKDLLDKVISSSSSEEDSESNILDHPAMLVTNSIVNRIIKKIIKKTKWKSSAEVIVDGVVSEIMKETLPAENENYKRLNKILEDLQNRLNESSSKANSKELEN